MFITIEEVVIALSVLLGCPRRKAERLLRECIKRYINVS